MEGLSGVVVLGLIVLVKGPPGTLGLVGELSVAAGFDHLVGIHEEAGVGVVGKDKAVKAPFPAKYVGQERIAATCPGVADAVK